MSEATDDQILAQLVDPSLELLDQGYEKSESTDLTVVPSLDLGTLAFFGQGILGWRYLRAAKDVGFDVQAVINTGSKKFMIAPSTNDDIYETVPLVLPDETFMVGGDGLLERFQEAQNNGISIERVVGDPQDTGLPAFDFSRIELILDMATKTGSKWNIENLYPGDARMLTQGGVNLSELDDPGSQPIREWLFVPGCNGYTDLDIQKYHRAKNNSCTTTLIATGVSLPGTVIPDYYKHLKGVTIRIYRRKCDQDDPLTLVNKLLSEGDKIFSEAPKYYDDFSPTNPGVAGIPFDVQALKGYWTSFHYTEIRLQLDQEVDIEKVKMAFEEYPRAVLVDNILLPQRELDHPETHNEKMERIGRTIDELKRYSARFGMPDGDFNTPMLAVEIGDNPCEIVIYAKNPNRRITEAGTGAFALWPHLESPEERSRVLYNSILTYGHHQSEVDAYLKRWQALN